MRTRRSYTQDEVDHAVALAVADGLAAASKETGISKTTIHNWVSRAGQSVEPVSKALAATAKAKAEAVVRQADRIEEVLEDIRSASGLYVHAVAVANRDYALAVLEAGDADFSQPALNPITGQAEVKPLTPKLDAAWRKVLALKQAGLDIPHAVGALTRATHDLQLLQGKATENQQVQVVFSAGLAGPSAEEVRALDESAVIVEGEVVE